MVLPIILSSVPIVAGYTGYKFVKAAIRKTTFQSTDRSQTEEQTLTVLDGERDQVASILQMTEC
jgi:hypothetical protein